MALTERLRRSRWLGKRGNPLLKPLDRLGTPALVLLGLLPSRRMPDRPRRIGFLRTASVGDTLLLSGVMRDVRAAYPDADITLITGAENADAGMLSVGGIGRLLRLPLASPPAALAAMRRERFDILIDTGAWPRFDALLTALSGASYRVGFRTRNQYRHYAYDASVDHDSNAHEIVNFRNLGRVVGTTTSATPSIPRANLSPVADTPVKPFAVFHPWAGGYRSEIREWPIDWWIELGIRMKSRFNSILVTGAPAQGERTEDLVRRLRANGVAAAGSTHSVRDVAWILAESEIVVGVNTSIPHLAAMLGTRAVLLHGPTAPARWGLVGSRIADVESTFSGCGYLDLGFDYAGHRTDCMLGVSVDAVERAMQDLLDRG